MYSHVVKPLPVACRWRFLPWGECLELVSGRSETLHWRTPLKSWDSHRCHTLMSHVQLFAHNRGTLLLLVSYLSHHHANHATRNLLCRAGSSSTRRIRYAATQRSRCVGRAASDVMLTWCFTYKNSGFQLIFDYFHTWKSSSPLRAAFCAKISASNLLWSRTKMVWSDVRPGCSFTRTSPTAEHTLCMSLIYMYMYIQ